MTIVSTYLPTFHKRFSLRTGKEAGSHTINEAKANISFQGANLWILLLAVLICSIGLNLNSTPVVIGAMLLSPLMGPIIGMGVGLAIYDTSMVWQGLRNLLAAFVLSILIAGLYFLLSPLQSATPEIIARSSPAIWDILIALAGGIVGAIALTRKEKGYTIIPGVAIATALMPPLCTAGYRLVQGDIITMFKALYLLFINTIYIAGATFLVARLLRLPKKEYPDTNTRNKVQWLVWSLVILTAIPGFRLTKNLLTHIIIQQQFTTFTQDIAQHYPVQVLQKSLNRETKTMNIWLIGSYLTNEEQDSITKNIRQHDNLKDYKLIIRQGVDANPELGEQIIQPLVTQALESQDSQTLSMIQQALKEYNAQTFQPEKVLKEAKVLEKSIESITFSYGTGEVSTTTTGELFTVSITTTQPLLLSKKQILEERIRTRIGQSESVIQWKEKNID